MATRSPSVAREPQARFYHAAVGVGQTHYVWGGISSGTSVQASTVECLDVPSATWQEPRQLRGHPLPDRLDNMAVTADGERAYSFGGRTGSVLSTFSNAVYEVNMTSLECRELAPASASPAPNKKYGSGMVHYQHMLVVYGGFTSEGRPTDELHVFDLNTNLWSVKATTGDRPPALSGLTLTKIDQHRAALFGGYDGSRRHNDTYVLDMATWHWSKVKTSGGRPPTRDDHACCIAGHLTGQPHPLLMVVGGWGDGLDVLSDVWVLDVAQGLWSQVALPTAITERWGHSAVIFGCGPDFRVVVLFGGRKTIFVGSEISETTFLLMSVRRDCWEVERVVGPGGLAAPDHRLREQMRRLQLSPQPLPTLKDLMTEVAAAIPHKWREVAVGLGLRAADIQRINAENPQQNCTQCFIAVFDTWERTETKPYIWKTIIDCLHSSLVNESKLAKEISARL